MMGLELTQEELEVLDELIAPIGMGGNLIMQSIRDKLDSYAASQPLSLREELRDHQKATGCSDDRMVQILCDFIKKLDDDGQLEAPWYQWLFEFVVEQLDEGPGQ